MPTQRVLVVGSGVSGSILAYWLARADFNITVVERSKASQKLGQGIEIEEPALKVVQAMGIMDKLNAIRTEEEGAEIVDEKYRVHARLGVGFGPTGALEMMRGDLTEVLYKTANESPNVNYEFETTIDSLEQTADHVTVNIHNNATGHTRKETFDHVIGADGQRSRTRSMIFGSPEELKCYHPVGCNAAWFSVPRTDRDTMYSQICQFPGRRAVWSRPVGKHAKEVSVYLLHLADHVPEMQEASAAGDRQKQKQIFAKIFSGLGWEVPRLLKDMMQSANFYGEQFCQVKLDRWSDNRVALVGDAAWAPTALTGQGNQLAIIGGWVLAQEMIRQPSPAAFAAYEARLRKYVVQCQEIPLNGYMPKLIIADTAWGIAVFRLVAWSIEKMFTFLRWSGITRLFPQWVFEDNFDLQIPEAESRKKK